MSRVGIGVVGVGVISRTYLETLTAHGGVDVVAVADLDLDRARQVADQHPGTRAVDVATLLADPAVDVVLNLTVPLAHEEVALAAIGAGKHVFGEKPLTATPQGARRVLAAADAAGVRVGCAPDTVLGTGVQTARAVVEAGTIGRPSSALATWVSPGHEGWHPQPDFYYREGGGPLLDMGPYYLTALVHLLGPVTHVQGAAGRARDERVIGSGPRAGERIPVEVATHVTGLLQHAGGAISTVTVSFDGGRSRARPIEVHGEHGSVSVPDPNAFDGEVEVWTPDAGWHAVPPGAGYAGSARGIGLLDMVDAVGLGGGAHRASGALAEHVLEVMTSLLTSADAGGRVAIGSRPVVPPLVPLTPRDAWCAAADTAQGVVAAER